MTIPLIKCKNLITGEVCTIPKEEGYPDSVFQFMEKSLQNELGMYAYNSLDFFVHETDKFKYCALLNESRTNDKGKALKIRYTQYDVESFCNSIERFAEENFSEMISYAHDVQYMIGTFVHRSIVNNNNKNDIDALRAALDDINVLAAIISAKDCFFRYRTNTFPEKFFSIDVTGKFFKIFKAYEKFGLVKDKKLQFDFQSERIPRIDTYEIFDFIPYIVLENAVKYAPNSSEINIDITQNGGFIKAVVGSMGPKLTEEEKITIFNKNVRGEIAKSMNIKGQGLGLYHLRQALSELSIGSVSVNQDNFSTKVEGFDCCYTQFTLMFQCKQCN